jgi:hypothetical protein
VTLFWDPKRGLCKPVESGIHISYFFEEKENHTMPTVINFLQKNAYIHICYFFEEKENHTMHTVIKFLHSAVCDFYNSEDSTEFWRFQLLDILYVRCPPLMKPRPRRAFLSAARVLFLPYSSP